MPRTYAADAKQSLFYITLETTSGTYEAPDVADGGDGIDFAVRLEEQPSWSIEGNPKVERNDTVQALPGGARPELGGKYREVSFEAMLTEWGSTSSADTKTGHELAAFFAACPMTITTGGTVAMVPANRTTSTVSVTWAEENGNVHSISGGRCQIESITAGDDMLVRIKGKVMGTYRNVQSVGDFEAAVGGGFAFVFAQDGNYSDEPIVRADNMVVVTGIEGDDSLTGTIVGLRSVEFNPNHALESRMDFTGTNGYTFPFASHAGNTTVAASFDVLSEDEFEIFAEAEGNFGAVTSFDFRNSAGDDKLTVDLVDGYWDFPEPGETSGIRTYDAVCRAVPTSGYNTYTLTFS